MAEDAFSANNLGEKAFARFAFGRVGMRIKYHASPQVDTFVGSFISWVMDLNRKMPEGFPHQGEGPQPLQPS